MNLCIAWGEGRLAPSSLRKRPQRIGIGLKCMFIPQFFMTSSKKKKQTDNFNSLGVREGEQKCLKKGQTFFCFKQISKCDTSFYMHFSRAFKNIVLDLQLQSQKFYGFFTDRTFFLPCTQPYKLKKYFFLQKIL